MVPALIADASDDAGRRYVQFFTTNIPTHTRAGLIPGPARGSSPDAGSAALDRQRFGGQQQPAAIAPSVPVPYPSETRARSASSAHT